MTFRALLVMGACCVACDDDTAQPVQTPVDMTPDTPDATPDANPDDPVLPGTPSRGCSSASDCNGGECVPITDGYSACRDPEARYQTNADAGDLGQCDGDQPCEAGACFSLAVAGGTSQCSPGGFDQRNVCIDDECSTDADCPNGGLCAPAGVAGSRLIPGFPRRRCVSATCRSNADCTAKPGGICGMIEDGCTPSGIEQWGYRDAQITCVYPDGCTRGADCTSGYCDVLDGAAVCLSRVVGSSP
jgi:hypothetical protein